MSSVWVVCAWAWLTRPVPGSSPHLLPINLSTLLFKNPGQPSTRCQIVTAHSVVAVLSAALFVCLFLLVVATSCKFLSCSLLISIQCCSDSATHTSSCNYSSSCCVHQPDSTIPLYLIPSSLPFYKKKSILNSSTQTLCLHLGPVKTKALTDCLLSCGFKETGCMLTLNYPGLTFLYREGGDNTKPELIQAD